MDLRDVGIRLWGFAYAPSGRRRFAFSLRDLHRLLGRKLRVREDRCLVLSTGSATTESRTRAHRYGVGRRLCSTRFRYAARMWQCAAEMGIDLANDQPGRELIVLR